MTPERLAALRVSAARAREHITPDSLTKIAASNRGKKQSAEWIRKRTEPRIGTKLPSAVRDKMKHAAKRRCSTPEGKQQMVAARRAMLDAKYRDQLWLFSAEFPHA